MVGPGSKRRTAGLIRRLRRLGWMGAVVLAGVWIGLGFVPHLGTDWVWFLRAAIFFVAAGLLWFAHDPSRDFEA